MLSSLKHQKVKKNIFLNLHYDRKFDRKVAEVEIA